METLVKKALIVVGYLDLSLSSTQAQVPKGNIFFGYSYLSADLVSSNRTSLNGWNGSLEGKIFPFIGIVADLSGHYGSTELPLGPSFHSDATLYHFLFGPRLSVSVGNVTPFAHVLVGASHADIGGDTDTSFSTAIGGGLDYKLIPAVAARFQADYLRTGFFSDTQNNIRISTGIVLRF